MQNKKGKTRSQYAPYISKQRRP